MSSKWLGNANFGDTTMHKTPRALLCTGTVEIIQNTEF
jgi:hypothetical protein